MHISPVITISAFADEIGPDLQEQMTVLAQEGIHHICLRNVWGKNVCDLTDAELLRVRRETAARGFGISSIGSPIGKIKVNDPFEPHLDRFRRAVVAAKVLDARFIRIFSFYGPDGKPPLQQRDEVITRIKALLAEVEGTGITLIHENESNIYGMLPEHCRDLLDAVGSPQLKQAFDPGNFIHANVAPFDSAWPLLAEQTVYLHVKDATLGAHEHRPFGEGDGQAREVLAALKAARYSGFATLEPHLAQGGQFGGFSGAENMRRAARALKRCLVEIGYEYN